MDAASFLESGLIDSKDILKLVTFLESTYSIDELTSRWHIRER